MGFEGPTTVLADRIRWQKSTNVAWLKARTGEEPEQAIQSSFLTLTSEKAKERRKPELGGKANIRWRASVRGSRTKARSRASIRRWKAP